MPTSTTFLPDVNVWLALASRRHEHSGRCAEWLDSLPSAQLFFCRVTQLGLLRLLTTEAAMGTDVLSSREAWRAYRTVLQDERIRFATEPFALEDDFQRLTDRTRPMPKLWTDAYLTSFARGSGLRVVTLDRAMLSLAADALLLS